MSDFTEDSLEGVEDEGCISSLIFQKQCLKKKKKKRRRKKRKKMKERDI